MGTTNLQSILVLNYPLPNTIMASGFSRVCHCLGYTAYIGGVVLEAVDSVCSRLFNLAMM